MRAIDSSTTKFRAKSNAQSKVRGFHAIVEHAGLISHLDCGQLETLLREVAAAANATVLGANFHDFGNGLGNTGVLMLAESHISIHTWPEDNYAAIDIFVCSENSHNGIEPVEAAIDVLRSADRHGRYLYQIIERAIPKREEEYNADALLVSNQQASLFVDS